LRKKIYLIKRRKTKMESLVYVAAAIAVAISCIGAGIGIGNATAKAVESVARQPEAGGQITKNLLLGCALAEATAIYGFVIALLIILLK
jgi:F-type H+-transporting ATPase subunit c